MLGGELEAHAYLQCGISRLRRAFHGGGGVGEEDTGSKRGTEDDDNIGDDRDRRKQSSVLEVELLYAQHSYVNDHRAGQDRGPPNENNCKGSVQYRCEVRNRLYDRNRHPQYFA